MKLCRNPFLLGLLFFLLVTGQAVSAMAEGPSASPAPGAVSEKFVAVLLADVHDGQTVATAAKGRAEFSVVEGGAGLAYTITVSGLEDAYMSHLRLGKSTDQHGSLVAWLWPTDRRPFEGKKGSFDGILASGVIRTKDLTGVLAKKKMEDLLAAIRAGKVDADIHTRRRMPGELRGLLVKQEESSR